MEDKVDFLSLTDLKNLLADKSVKPSRKRGQNFLIDRNLINWIAHSVPSSSLPVLEIGTGPGALTSALLNKKHSVLGVEVDKRLFNIICERKDHFNINDDNLVLLNMDILKNKNKINPIVLNELDSFMESKNAAEFQLVSNLPYSIAAPALSGLVQERNDLKYILATVQLEFAQKMISEPASDEWGPISILLEITGKAEILKKISPAVFWPRPEINSATVLWTRKKQTDRKIINAVKIARKLFLHRRKKAVKLLRNIYSEKGRNAAFKVGITSNDRPDHINSSQFLKLSELLENYK